jgi:predicted RNA-binding protein YlxR (DUF448 family)
VLNNPGRAQYVCQELLKLSLSPDMERLARERESAVMEQLVRQRITISATSPKKARPAA